MSFSKKILAWYAINKRELPWRATQEPYPIWLSEVILQQTRVAQGLPYYEKFITAFPTVFHLAKASEEEVLKLWQGLGYYSRARNMHHTAKQIVNDFGGVFPQSYSGLLKLKGVGDYTASAIASICFNEKVPVVDGNVYRVLSRCFGIDLPINSTAGVKAFKRLAHEVMPHHSIRDYNQGIMEFGAIQCTPKKPACMYCPIKTSCKALEQGRVMQLPVKLKKNKVKIRYFNYLVIVDPNRKIILEQRKGKGIWENLYQFPLVESDGILSLDLLKKQADPHVKQALCISKFNTEPIVHKLSHQHLHTTFWVLEVEKVSEDGIPPESLRQYPVPVLISNFLKAFLL